jgi:hypothetical protein
MQKKKELNLLALSNKSHNQTIKSCKSNFRPKTKPYLHYKLKQTYLRSNFKSKKNIVKLRLLSIRSFKKLFLMRIRFSQNKS